MITASQERCLCTCFYTSSCVVACKQNSSPVAATPYVKTLSFLFQIIRHKIVWIKIFQIRPSSLAFSRQRFQTPFLLTSLEQSIMIKCVGESPTAEVQTVLEISSPPKGKVTWGVLCCDGDFPHLGYHTQRGWVLVAFLPHCTSPCPNFLYSWSFMKIYE